MENQNNKLLAVLNWLLPSGSGVMVYFITSCLTLASSNAGFFRNFFDLPKNFHFKNAVLDSINDLVQRFVGDHVARSAVVAIFWAVVGLFVYVVIWVLINYSDELGNDLAVTKYQHPRNVDTHSQLRDFISKSIFQVFALLILIFYINLIIGVLLPRIGDLFQVSIQKWPSVTSFGHGLMGFLVEFIILHFMVILIRLLTLRKRIFG